MEEWEVAQEVKRTRRVLRTSMRAFSKVVLAGRWGTWRARHPASTPLAPVMAIGRLLDHPIKDEWAALHYADSGTMAVLFDRDAWPKALVIFSGDLRRRKAAFGVREIRSAQSVLVGANSPYASAVRALLRRMLGPPGPRWGEAGAYLLRPTSLPSMLALWHMSEGRVEALSEEGQQIRTPRDSYGYWQPTPAAKAAHAILVLLSGPDDELVSWPSRIENSGAETSWEVRSTWPQELGENDPTVLNWLKPYPLHLIRLIHQDWLRLPPLRRRLGAAVSA